jgi:hypothetical protein
MSGGTSLVRGERAGVGEFGADLVPVAGGVGHLASVHGRVDRLGLQGREAGQGHLAGLWVDENIGCTAVPEDLGGVGGVDHGRRGTLGDLAIETEHWMFGVVAVLV